MNLENKKIIITGATGGICNSLVEKFYGHKSKCFDCERQYDHPYKYKGHSSRCFSCETDLDRRLGPEYGFYGQPNKCYDCEKQMTF